MQEMPWFHRDFEQLQLQRLPWKRLEKKRLLITGSTGFIASYFIKMLLMLNDRYHLQLEIYALCRNVKKASSLFQNRFDDQALHLMVENIVTPFLDGLPQMDILFHMASPAAQQEIESNPISLFDTNIIATRYLLEYAALHGAIMYYFSSGLVYLPSEKPHCEEDPIRGIANIDQNKSFYVISKVIGERLCREFHQRQGVEMRILRLFAIFGPGENLHSGRSVMQFLHSVLEDKTIEMLSAGNAVRDYCYVQDVVSAIFYALLYGKSDTYNVGNSHNTASILELAYEFAKHLPQGSQLGVVRSIHTGGNKDIYLADTNKLHALGWMPAVSLQEGVERMVNDYKLLKSNEKFKNGGRIK